MHTYCLFFADRPRSQRAECSAAAPPHLLHSVPPDTLRHAASVSRSRDTVTGQSQDSMGHVVCGARSNARDGELTKIRSAFATMLHDLGQTGSFELPPFVVLWWQLIATSESFRSSSC